MHHHVEGVERTQEDGYTFLPPVAQLIDRLNALEEAERASDEAAARQIASEIAGMAKTGIYEGYPQATPKPQICAVIGVERVNQGVNIHTFRVCYLVLSDSDPDDVQYMDLIDFLSPTWRTNDHVSQAQH